MFLMEEIMSKTIKEELNLLNLKQTVIAKRFDLSQPEISTIMKHETTIEKIHKFLRQIKGIK